MKEENQKTEKSEVALREERILKFWKENDVFNKSLKQREGGKKFVFYEGPPTANGKPGIHHLAARAFKDAIPRYKTMQGYYVRRKGGWDTHGLPVELQVEKKLGLNSKKAIEEYGIDKFNQECKESVWEYLDVWNRFTKRIGFWIDQDDPYVTYENDYIESVWNILKKTDEQGLLYKDYRIVPWCPRCGTALSSHELAQGYQDVKDLSVTAKFKVIGQENTYTLAWTTTPWTLPGNLALAVGEDISYVKVRVGEEVLILAKARIEILTGKYEILEELKGRDLVGLKYEPLFPYLIDVIPEEEKNKLDKAYQVYGADFVTTEDGTGVVHTAVMYGQDDFVLGAQIGLPKHHLVGLDGKFIEGTDFLAGRFTRDEETAVEIIKNLAHRGLLFKKEKYEHSYPHCWRCKTGLIYYARDSWYIRMSDPKVKEKLVNENKSINWEPSHIRGGRFGEWLREIKDWAISRERYWGTPLPVWECEKCDKREVLGSVEELQKRVQKSGNKYILMRHGETDTNLKGLVSTKMNSGSHLTEKGIKDTVLACEGLKKENIDIIFSSPFNRTRETTEVIKKELNFDEKNIFVDERIGEIQVKSYEGKTWKEYDKDFPKSEENFNKAHDGDESLQDVKTRTMNFLFDLEEKYKNKNILIVTHGGPAWLAITGVKRLDAGRTLALIRDKTSSFRYLDNSSIHKLEFTPFPHNKYGEFDLHRPYIDDIALVCDCGGAFTRTKEVMDVWLDSGAMPFAQDHYPFQNKSLVDADGFPADYISEAIDQTRGWFYTLHAVGVLMGRGKAYKNVICLGHLLDKGGKKMSKSLGNVVDPWEMMDKYGVDALRLWMYSVNQPGESKNFDEKTVALISQQVFGLLYNVLAFYELYRDTSLESQAYNDKSSNTLDRWIIARLNELIEDMTKNMDNYKLLEPVRAMRDFMSDLSTWYLRRSRERIKDGDKEAKETLYFVLKTISKLLAPFAPLSAEDIWQRLKTEGDKESVHLESWPTSLQGMFSKFFHKEEKIIKNMRDTRVVITLGLDARQKASIKVRQPLSQLQIKNYKLGIEYLELIKDELNVKDALENKDIEDDILLNIDITPKLKEEGDYRELARGLQTMRKQMGLIPSDMVSLVIETGSLGRDLVMKFEVDIKKTVSVSEIKFEKNDGEEITIDNLDFKIRIDK